MHQCRFCIDIHLFEQFDGFIPRTGRGRREDIVFGVVGDEHFAVVATLQLLDQQLIIHTDPLLFRFIRNGTRITNLEFPVFGAVDMRFGATAIKPILFDPNLLFAFPVLLTLDNGTGRVFVHWILGQLHLSTANTLHFFAPRRRRPTTFTMIRVIRHKAVCVAVIPSAIPVESSGSTAAATSVRTMACGGNGECSQ